MKILKLKCPDFNEPEAGGINKMILRFLKYEIEGEDKLSTIAVKYINGIDVDVDDIKFIEDSIVYFIETFNKDKDDGGTVIDKINHDFKEMFEFINGNDVSLIEGIEVETEKAIKAKTEKAEKAINKIVSTDKGIPQYLKFIYNHTRNDIESYLFSIQKISNFHNLIEENKWLLAEPAPEPTPVEKPEGAPAVENPSPSQAPIGAPAAVENPTPSPEEAPVETPAPSPEEAAPPVETPAPSPAPAGDGEEAAAENPEPSPAPAGDGAGEEGEEGEAAGEEGEAAELKTPKAEGGGQYRRIRTPVKRR